MIVWRPLMDTLICTVALARAMQVGNTAEIDRLISELERLLRPEDLVILLEGLLGDVLPESLPPPLVACA